MLTELFTLDRDLFYYIQDTFGNGSHALLPSLMSNIYFWTPWLIFLFTLIHLKNPKRGLLNIVFGLGAIVLTYQICYLLALLVKRPSPFWIQSVINGSTFVMEHGLINYSFPDWAMASYTAFLQFSLKKVGDGQVNLFFGTLVFSFLAFFRIQTGICYPLDAAFGTLIGFGTGWALAGISKNAGEVLFNPRGS